MLLAPHPLTQRASQLGHAQLCAGPGGLGWLTKAQANHLLQLPSWGGSAGARGEGLGGPLAPHLTQRASQLDHVQLCARPGGLKLARETGQGDWPRRLATETGQGDWPGRLAKETGQRDWPKRLARETDQGDWPGRLARETGQGVWPQRLARETGQGDWPRILARETGQGDWPGRLARETGQGGWPGRLARETGQGDFQVPSYATPSWRGCRLHVWSSTTTCAARDLQQSLTTYVVHVPSAVLTTTSGAGSMPGARPCVTMAKPRHQPHG